MKEHPILFRGTMVRALIEGRKTQTRRIIKPQPERIDGILHWKGEEILPEGTYRAKWTPGDRLWVRETWAPHADLPRHAIYRADPGGDYQDNVTEGFKWRPSIQMPRWASRLTLEVTAVRVEQLQHISDADAIAEGIRKGKRATSSHCKIDTWWDYLRNEPGCLSPRSSYSSLWESIHGPGSWGANPWVWVIAFKRVEAQRNHV